MSKTKATNRKKLVTFVLEIRGNILFTIFYYLNFYVIISHNIDEL